MRTLAALLLLASLARAEEAEEAKPTASVLDPKATGMESEELEVLGEAIRDTVVAAEVYRVQDRGAMLEVLAQQKMNQSEACDETCTVQQGRLLQVRYLVSSTIRRVKETVWVSIHMTDVESGEVVGSARGTSKGELEDLATLSEKLTRQVLGGEEEAPEAAAALTVTAAPPPKAPEAPAPEALSGVQAGAAAADKWTGQVITFQVTDPDEDFEVSVQSRIGLRRCQTRVRFGESCTITGVPPGPATVLVRGTGDLKKSFAVPSGKSQVNLDYWPDTLGWAGCGMGIGGLVMVVGGAAVGTEGGFVVAGLGGLMMLGSLVVAPIGFLAEGVRFWIRSERPAGPVPLIDRLGVVPLPEGGGLVAARFRF